MDEKQVENAQDEVARPSIFTVLALIPRLHRGHLLQYPMIF